MIFIFLGVVFFAYPSWILLSPLDLWVYGRKNFAHYFYKYFFYRYLSSVWTPAARVLDCYIQYYKLLLFSFFVLLFLFCIFPPFCFILDIFYCYVFDLLLVPPNVFFISRNSILALQKSCMSSLNTSMFTVAFNIFVCQALCLLVLCVSIDLLFWL